MLHKLTWQTMWLTTGGKEKPLCADIDILLLSKIIYYNTTLNSARLSVPNNSEHQAKLYIAVYSSSKLPSFANIKILYCPL